MSVTFSFEDSHAEKYGLPEAVVLYHIRFWIEQNNLNERNRKEGRTWMYQSRKEMATHFSFFSVDKLDRIFNKLCNENGPLISGNFNTNEYLQTKWYAFKNENEWIREKYKILHGEHRETAKSRNGNNEIAESIKDNKQIITLPLSLAQAGAGATPPSKDKPLEVVISLADLEKLKAKYGVTRVNDTVMELELYAKIKPNEFKKYKDHGCVIESWIIKENKRRKKELPEWTEKYATKQEDSKSSSLELDTRAQPSQKSLAELFQEIKS